MLSMCVMGLSSVVDFEMCIDQEVGFGDSGSGVLHGVKYLSPCGMHPVDSSIHFCTFEWQHGQLDPFGLAKRWPLCSRTVTDVKMGHLAEFLPLSPRGEGQYPPLPRILTLFVANSQLD